MDHEVRPLTVGGNGARGALRVAPPAPPTPPDVAEANKALMRRYIEGFWNRADPDIVDRFVAPDVVLHDLADTPLRGRWGLKQNARLMQAAMPDFRMTIDDLIAEGDRVVVRWTGRGTHTGVFQGVPPTHRRAAWTAISVVRIADGRMVEGWQEMNLFGLLQQLGVLPSGTLPLPMRWFIGLQGRIRAWRQAAER